MSLAATLLGADSATPKPTHYAGKNVWGVYIAGATFHIWSKADLYELAWRGVAGVIPIVVPSQTEKWWQTNYGYTELEALARAAVEWGVPEGAPLCLDVEEFQSAQFGAGATNIARAWAIACHAHKLIPWAYGSAAYLEKDLWGNRWLAEWPDVTPANPRPPAGYRGWQYKGNDDGIDLDVFFAGETFLSTDFEIRMVDGNRVLIGHPVTIGGAFTLTPAEHVAERTEPDTSALSAGVTPASAPTLAPTQREGKMASNPVNLPSLTQLEIGVTKLAAIAGAVEGSTNLGGLPAWLRVTLLSVSGAIIALNHWLNVTVKTPAPPS
jgi:hypothetical protein